jgi:hypothetical protein
MWTNYRSIPELCKWFCAETVSLGETRIFLARIKGELFTACPDSYSGHQAAAKLLDEPWLFK